MAVGRVVGASARLSVAVLVGLALLLVLAGPARAEFEGSPGKVAYVDASDGEFPLEIWDPALASSQHPNAGIEEVIESTFHRSGSQEVVVGHPSPPVFSPDGTKIAYSMLVPDPGYPAAVTGYHTAIYVMNADGTEQHALTHPDNFAPGNPNPPPDIGHEVADSMPAWSPDGSQIAFIRQVGAGKEDALAGEVGTNIWTVGASGGGATQITTGKNRIYSSVVWTENGLAAVYAENGTGVHIGTLTSGGGAPTSIASPLAVSDWDVSPDFKTIAFTTQSISAGGTVLRTISTSGGHETELGKVPTTLTRYSNTDNGPLQTDCAQQTGPNHIQFQQCGLFERHVEDPGGETHAADPADRFSLPWIDFGGVSESNSRDLWDVQAQQLPIVFVPGFLGSKIECSGSAVWPPSLGNPLPDLDLIALDPSGTGNADCASAGPDGTLVGKVATLDIYEGVQEFLKNLKLPKEIGGGKFPTGVYGWDWRKTPQENTEGLDTLIEEKLHPEGGPGLLQKEGVGRVVLFGHSYGGLLIRTYLSEHADKVARVLTEGTPYWGSPKAIFPLAFGDETPLGSPLNYILRHDKLQPFARNLPGLYQLYPSEANYGPWLSINGTPLDHDGIAAAILQYGGQPSLYAAAQANHQSLYDGFFDNYGQIDYRAVVGGGIPTVTKVDIAPDPSDPHKAGVHLTLGSGDETVPERSAIQGSVEEPLGARARIQVICGVAHTALPNNSRILAAYTAFLTSGRNPRKLDPPGCADPGSVLDFKSVDGLKLEAGAAAHRARSAVRAGTGGEMTLDEASEEGLIDLFETDPQVFAILNGYNPVTLGFDAEGVTFTYAPVEGESEGTPLRFGPLDGHVVVAPGPGQAAPVVTLDGVPVAGTPVEEGGGPSGGAGGGGSSQAPAPPPGPGPVATPCSSSSGKKHALCLARRRCRKIKAAKKRSRCLSKLKKATKEKAPPRRHHVSP